MSLNNFKEDVDEITKSSADVKLLDVGEGYVMIKWKTNPYNYGMTEDIAELIRTEYQNVFCCEPPEDWPKRNPMSKMMITYYEVR